MSRTVTIGSATGLHSRPAGIVAKAAGSAGVPITIARDGSKPVNAASILSIISLGLAHGEEVTIASEAAEGTAALENLAQLLESDLDQA